MINPLNWHHLATFLVLTMFICDCGPVQHEDPQKSHPLQLDVIATGIYGLKTDSQASTRWITTTEAIQNIFAELDRRYLSKGTVSFTDINFDRCWVLLIEMGQKSTGGYSISLNKASSYVSDEKAVVCLNWDIPDKDVAVAQVMTSPYLLLKTIKGNYRKVVVVDQENHVLFEVDTPR